MFKRARSQDTTKIEALVWESFIPPLSAEAAFKDALVVCEWIPLQQGIMWLDFSSIEFSTAYTLTVDSIMDDGSVRPLVRVEVTFGKPTPGWPAAVIVNEVPQRLDGLLDVGFGVYPFGRIVKIVQRKGRESTLRVCSLTDVCQPVSVQA